VGTDQQQPSARPSDRQSYYNEIAQRRWKDERAFRRRTGNSPELNAGLALTCASDGQDEFHEHGGGVRRLAFMASSQRNEDEAANMRRAAQHAEYDTCSGDSCWVRQYLEWCNLASTVAADDDREPTPAGVARVVST
jgi:hypothetical protein